MSNNPLTDAELAELDRMYAAATKGMNWHEVAFWHAAIAQRYPALRQRLTDAEAYRAEVEAAKPTVQALLDSGERAASEAAEKWAAKLSKK